MMPVSLILSIVETVIQDTPEALALFGAIKDLVGAGGDPAAPANPAPAQWHALAAAMLAIHRKIQAA